MPLTVACQNCGHAVIFTEEDRGGDLYCPACQHACAIPLSEGANAAPAATSAAPQEAQSAPRPAPPSQPLAPRPAAPQPQSRVFSDRGLAQLDDRIVGKIRCFCGAENPVRPADYGNTIYCNSCGTELQVGEDLRQANAAAALGKPEEAPRAPVQARFRLFQSPLGMAAAILIALMSTVGAYFTRQTWQPALQGMGLLPPPPPPPLRLAAANSDLPPFDPDALKVEMIEALLEDPDPFQAIIQALAWRDALREHAIPVDDPRAARLAILPAELLAAGRDQMLAQVAELPDADHAGDALDQAIIWLKILEELKVATADKLWMAMAEQIPALMERADPITVAMIEELLKSPDPADALEQTSLWTEKLHDRQAPQNDSRFASLEGVRTKLLARLSTPASNVEPECVAPFKKAVQSLADALHRLDLPAARESEKQADVLYSEHAEELRYHATRLLALKGRLRQLEAKAEGPAQVRDLFQQVTQRLAEAERLQTENPTRACELVTEAIITDAKARHRIFQGSWKANEIEEFEKLGAEKLPHLQFARGWRAVLDAQRCDQARDVAGRRFATKRAFALLQGLPESQIKPWLDRVRAWSDEKSSAQNPKRPSDLGAEMEARERFESCLEFYARGDEKALAAACAEAHKAIHSAIRQAGSWGERLGNLLFDVLEGKIAMALNASADSDPAKAFESLRSARGAIDLARPWRTHPRWLALDAAIRQSAAPHIRRALDEAKALAAKGDYAAAARLAGGPADLASADLLNEAQALKEEWTREADLRASQKAEAEAWVRISALDQRHRTEEIFPELERYLQRWPQGPHSAEVAKLRQSYVAAAQQKFAEELERLERDAANSDWPAVGPRLVKLLAAATTEQQRASLQKVQQRQQAVIAGVLAEFERLRQRPLVFNDDEILEIRGLTAKILIVQPDHAAAKALLAKANERASKAAAEILRQAPMYRTLKPALYREKLERALTLDPQGEYGRQAAELLKKLT